MIHNLIMPKNSTFDPNGAGIQDANIFGLNFTLEESNVVLIPVPWEATTSYGRGTAQGPQAIFEASPQLDLFDADLAPLGLSCPWKYGIAMEPIAGALVKLNKKACKLAKPIVAAGGQVKGHKTLERNLRDVNLMSETLNAWVYERSAAYLKRNKIVGIIGGDHSVSFGAIQAAAERHPGLGILHIDAHADLREAYEGFSFSHASIMHNVVSQIPQVGRLVQVGIRDFCDSEFEMATGHPKIKTFFDSQVKNRMFGGESWATLCKEIIASLPENVYVSFDIDGLEPWLCPNTGTPVPGGLNFNEAIFLVKMIHTAGKKIVAFDLNEVAPGDRKDDQWNGNVGARILYKLCGVSLLSQGANDASLAREISATQAVSAKSEATTSAKTTPGTKKSPSKTVAKPAAKAKNKVVQQKKSGSK